MESAQNIIYKENPLALIIQKYEIVILLLFDVLSISFMYSDIIFLFPQNILYKEIMSSLRFRTIKMKIYYFIPVTELM